MKCFQLNRFMNCINASWTVLMQNSSKPNVNFFDISSEPNMYELFSSEPSNLQNSNDILLCGRAREQGGPRRRWRWAWRRSRCAAWTQRWLRKRSARCQGRRGGGAGARRGPTNGRGGGQCGVEVPVEEERAHGVDLAAVREVVGEVPTLTRRRWRHGAGRGGGVGMRVAGKMIVARVRV
jgi:hypothetical protein